jgi:hypothetical protein
MIKKIFLLEARKLLNRKTIIIFVVIFILVSIFSWDGVVDYKENLKSLENFQSMERDKVSMHIHYTFYGIRGVRLLFIPAPISVIFNDSSVYDGMVAHIDTAEKLQISNSFKGKDLFPKSGGYMDFSGIMLILGSFLGLLYGFDINRNKGYLRFLSDTTYCKNPAFIIMLSRAILLNIFFWFLCAMSILWLIINGINILNTHSILYILGLTIIITLFLFAGTLIGTIKAKGSQFITLIILYFTLVFFLPWLIQKAVYMEARSGLNSIHSFEYEMLKMMMKIETQLLKRFGVWRSGQGEAPDKIKVAIQEALNKDWVKLKYAEKIRKEKIKERIINYQSLSSLFPTTFYLSLNKELSSKGFLSFDNFYQFAFDKKYSFLKFYIEKKFYDPVPKKGVEPFIKGNEDLFYAQSRLPESFKFGILFSFVWIGLLGLICWFRLDRTIIHRPKKQAQEPKLELQENKTKVIITFDSERFKRTLTDLRFQYPHMIYIPCWSNLDEMSRVKWYFSFFNVPVPDSIAPIANNYIFTLKPDQKAMILIELIRSMEADLFVFNNFLTGLSDEFSDYFVSFLNELKEGRRIVYFSSSLAVSSKIADSVTRYTDEPPV